MGDSSEETFELDTEWGSDAAPRDVTITHLQMLTRPTTHPVHLPPGARIERAQHPTPELARWLYGVVGGPYRWYERLSWDRDSWQKEIAEEGSEIWLIMLDGTPAGYCQLHATVAPGTPASTETEILYFGLMDWAQGQGLGRAFLETVIEQAWQMDSRHRLPPVSRIWVHTCDLDSPYALDNYCARGFEIYARQIHREVILKQPLGSWEAMFTR